MIFHKPLSSHQIEKRSRIPTKYIPFTWYQLRQKRSKLLHFPWQLTKKRSRHKAMERRCIFSQITCQVNTIAAQCHRSQTYSKTQQTALQKNRRCLMCYTTSLPLSRTANLAWRISSPGTSVRAAYSRRACPAMKNGQ